MLLPSAIGPQRLAFLSWLERQDGKTSLWAKKGPDLFDCSGLVTVGYEKAGVPMFNPLMTNTDTLWGKLPSIAIPSPGDLVLYGGSALSDVEHVMVWWGDGIVFGACGATSRILNREEAERAGARVRMRALSYRRDFRGFRRSPLDIKDLIVKQREVL
jgi:cell wall-associated NlpC family hydrolase